MKRQAEHSIPFLCLCSGSRPGTRVALLTQKSVSFSHVILPGSSNSRIFAGSSGIGFFFSPKDEELEKKWIDQTLSTHHMVKSYPYSCCALLWHLPHSSNSITRISVSSCPPSIACSDLPPVCGYSKDKLCSSDLVRLLHSHESTRCLGKTEKSYFQI